MDNKVVVITGASAGIGKALALRLGRAGVRLGLVARRRAELESVARESGTEALPVIADVTERPQVDRALAEVLKRFGKVDVWVNNAGRGISRPVSQLTDADLDEMMRVNVKSALYGMQAVLAHFKESKAGHIINISSMLGRVPYFHPRSAYSASKHALNALTANLRMELRADFPGIHVSTIHPGVVATEFGANAVGGGVDSRKIPGAQSVDEVAEVIAQVIEKPRADVYTRPGFQADVVRYFQAEDMGAYEAQLGGPPRQSP